MSTVARVQCTLESTSLIPENDAINVWHFQILTGDVGSNITDIKIALNTFYAQIEDIYNVNTLTGVIRQKTYDLADSAPRTPVDAGELGTFTFSDADALPTECAITMSFEGELASGTNRARRRGRVYLGPLDIGPASTTDGYVRVGITMAETITAAASNLISAGGLDWRWCVFSPTTAGTPPWSEATLGLASIPVDHGWVDDAFDTQRRRGTAAQFRYTFTG